MPDNQPNPIHHFGAAKDVITLGDDHFELFISHDQIQARLSQLARSIESDYVGKQPIFVGLLNGAFIFMADLIRHIDAIPIEVDFFKLSSYGDAKISSGKVHQLKSVDAKLTGRDVIVVEDVVDSGLSISYIRNEILSLAPSSLRFCSLLHKPEVARLDFTLDYVGFEIPKEFVIGYGLDIRQTFRNLPHIYRLKPTP